MTERLCFVCRQHRFYVAEDSAQGLLYQVDGTMDIRWLAIVFQKNPATGSRYDLMRVFDPIETLDEAIDAALADHRERTEQT